MGGQRAGVRGRMGDAEDAGGQNKRQRADTICKEDLASVWIIFGGEQLKVGLGVVRKRDRSR